ncbi:ComF family protein [Macrococcus capreoli]|uniref:ComF family protein n=1 Tax=Macrococcus capreoli TaxID=2982690 RepID=UPI0021D5B9FF|nr:ComF family protein [Macrococcus sp. TMW 2.2395]MCU7556305.1 ComF family protein [Macrococcus sp. TMW 2.2395]
MTHQRCIICHQPIHEILTIDNLFKRVPFVCDDCKQTVLQRHDVRRCTYCQKALAEDETDCLDCQFILKYFGFVNHVNMICEYHEEMSKLLHQYKSNGDVLLAKAFAQIFQSQLTRQYFKAFDMVIPMPTSNERLRTRGFNPVSTILDAMHVQYSEVLTTAYREKQMGLNKIDRMKQDNPFKCIGSLQDNARILLVDDIYTTGLTASHASSVLLSNKHCEITVLAFARA